MDRILVTYCSIAVSCARGLLQYFAAAVVVVVVVPASNIMTDTITYIIIIIVIYISSIQNDCPRWSRQHIVRMYTTARVEELVAASGEPKLGKIGEQLWFDLETWLLIEEVGTTRWGLITAEMAGGHFASLLPLMTAIRNYANLARYHYQSLLQRRNRNNNDREQRETDAGNPPSTTWTTKCVTDWKRFARMSIEAHL